MGRGLWGERLCMCQGNRPALGGICCLFFKWSVAGLLQQRVQLKIGIGDGRVVQLLITAGTGCRGPGVRQGPQGEQVLGHGVRGVGHVASASECKSACAGLYQISWHRPKPQMGSCYAPSGHLPPTLPIPCPPSFEPAPELPSTVHFISHPRHPIHPAMLAILHLPHLPFQILPGSHAPPLHPFHPVAPFSHLVLHLPDRSRSAPAPSPTHLPLYPLTPPLLTLSSISLTLRTVTSVSAASPHPSTRTLLPSAAGEEEVPCGVNGTVGRRKLGGVVG